MSSSSGTVTFLFTDIEGSTRLWQADEEAMQEAVARHDALLQSAISEFGGRPFSTMGDGIAAVFPSAHDAVAATVQAQLRLSSELWSTREPIRVRMGVHSGEAQKRDGDYFGTEVNRAARLMSAGHGGQILVSGATAPLVIDRLPKGAELIALGEHRLRDLGRPEMIFELVHSELAREVRPLRTLDTYPGNLPLQLSSFIGRERELTRTFDALAQGRVVTLTGVGGVGKTRLALQVAGESLPRFREGAWLIELGPVRDSDGVLSVCTSTLEVTASGGKNQLDSLLEFLRPKELLLVLDNCEHVLEPVADLVESVERSCQGITVLATSREGLAVDGERVIPVPSLRQPDADAGLSAVAQTEAVRLFTDRALAADPDFTLTGSNYQSVARICTRLDGVPLAIELAAARVRSMTPTELAEGLDHRFATLAGGRRRAVERHQTLRAAIDWSYDLLEPGEQALLDRLAVFAGGCTRDAAEQICTGPPLESAAVQGALSNLVTKSLVDEQRDTDETRFRLLETNRAYGEEHLAQRGETDRWRDRHAEYFTKFSIRIGLEILGSDEVVLTAAWVAEVDNLLLALAHFVDTGNVDGAIRLYTGVLGSDVFSVPRRLPIGELMAMPGVADHPLFPLMLALAGTEAALRGDPEAAVAMLERARTLDQGSEPMVNRLWNYAQAMMAVAAGDQRSAASFMEQAASQEDGPARRAQALASAAMFEVMAGELGQAEADARSALDLARRVGAPSIIMAALTSLAGALVDADNSAANEAFREACDLWPPDLSTTRTAVQIVFVGARLGAWTEVLARGSAAVRFCHWHGDRPQLAGVLNVVSAALADTYPEAAAVLLGMASTLATSSAGPDRSRVPGPSPTPPSHGSQPTAGNFIAELRRSTIDQLRVTLGDERLDDLRRRGRAMSYQDTASYAVEAIQQAQRLTSDLNSQGG